MPKQVTPLPCCRLQKRAVLHTTQKCCCCKSHCKPRPLQLAPKPFVWPLIHPTKGQHRGGRKRNRTSQLAGPAGTQYSRHSMRLDTTTTTITTTHTVLQKEGSVAPSPPSTSQPSANAMLNASGLLVQGELAQPQQKAPSGTALLGLCACLSVRLCAALLLVQLVPAARHSGSCRSCRRAHQGQ